MATLRGDLRFRYLKQFFLVIYCSFLKKGGQIGGVVVFNATFNNISVISWLSCFIGGVNQENHRPAASLTNLINNVVSSNKGVLIADIYIRTTVYINPPFPRGNTGV